LRRTWKYEKVDGRKTKDDGRRAMA